MPLSRDRVLKSVRKLRKFLKKTPKRPSPDEIHDFRTHARRLETSLNALSLNSGNDRRVIRRLKPLRKRAGKVRDMDVLTVFASKHNINGEGGCLAQLLEYLGAERYRQAKRFHKKITKDGAELRKRLKRTSIHVEKVIRDGTKNGTQESQRAPADAMAMGLEIATDLANPARLDRSNLHEYRLKVKELRYVLRLAAEAGNRDFVKELGEVKDAIGEWHDREELATLGAEVLDHRNCKLLRELKETSDRKYESSLSLAEKMRDKYFRQRHGTKKQPTVDRAPSKEVLAATSAIN